MTLDDCIAILSAIRGCTFASLDALTVPKPGIKKMTTGERVLLFGNTRASGYESMVKRRLAAVGKNPDDFVLRDLPWGERLDDTPVIQHAGEDYIQTILLAPGDSHYYIGDVEVDPYLAGIVKQRRPDQGLPRGGEVRVHTYNIKHLTRLTLLGETLT